MGTHTEVTQRDGVATVVLDGGPAARLTASLLAGLSETVAKLDQEADVDVIVLRGKGAFPSGVTVPSCGGDDRKNLLAQVCVEIENSAKPVVAVLTGAVIGGGAELALAAHYRLAQDTARLGFPYARLGLVPRAGATQRLPRLAGGALSAELLLGGNVVMLSENRMAPLVDGVFSDDAEAAVRRLIESHADGKLPTRPTSRQRKGYADPQAFQAALGQAKSDVQASPETAPKQILSALEASLLLPIEAGLAFEAAAAEDCAETAQARALSHLFRNEQRVNAQTRRTDLPTLNRIAVLGGGPHAAHLVLAALQGGLEVSWLIKDPAKQRESVGLVHGLLQHNVLNARLTADAAARCRAALQCGEDISTVSGANIALRAARGQRGVTLPPDLRVAHCLPGTDTRLSLQFSMPAGVSPLVEAILGPDADERDQALALSVAQRLNKVAVVEKTDKTCIHDRLLQTLWRASDALIDRGQSPYAIDHAMRDWGMETPPYALADSVSFTAVAKHDRFEGCHNWSEILVETGRDGVASGQGFYAYPAGQDARTDKAVLDTINAVRLAQPSLPKDQIATLLIGAMANTGAKILREAVVPHSGDIDLVSVLSHLVPRWRGGVMHAAGAFGLLHVSRAMQGFDHPDRAIWTPDPVFADLVKYGRSFDDL